MIHLKVSLMLGGDPYDSARMDNIETLVRDRLADMLESDRGFVEVTRLPCAAAMAGGAAECDRPSGHEGGHSGAVRGGHRITDNTDDDWSDYVAPVPGNWR